MNLHPLAAVAVAFALAGPHQTPTEKRLRAKIERLERSRDHWKTRATRLAGSLRDANAGLPDAIRSVPAGTFPLLVLEPAYQQWRSLGYCADRSTLTVTSETGSRTIWNVGFHSWGLNDC